MVSMQQTTSLPLEERKARSMTFEAASSKKRKWEDETGGEVVSRDPTKDHVELHFDTPLPVEWQRCLDIKSGQVHFYNTRTKKRTCDDPRLLEPKLDLELNLTCEPTKEKSAARINNGDRDDNYKYCKLYATPKSKWMSLSVDGDHREEMVAGVCVRCHMLVMMCKAAPSCPNCKFVHPPATQCSSQVARISSIQARTGNK